MIAAGVGDRVGLRLFVLSQARMEAANFPNGEYRDADFVYDWSSRPWGDSRVIARRFDAAFTRHRDAEGASLWLTESSRAVARDAVSFFTAPYELVGVRDAGAGDAGASGRPSDDIRVAYAHFGERAHLTRLRADFPGAMLDRDLELAASDRPDRPPSYSYASQINVPPPPTCPDGSRYDPALRRFVGAQPWPPCPTYPDASTTPAGLDAGDDAGDTDAKGGAAPTAHADGGCDAGPTRSPRPAWSLAALLGVLAALARRSRRSPRD